MRLTKASGLLELLETVRIPEPRIHTAETPGTRLFALSCLTQDFIVQPKLTSNSLSSCFLLPSVGYHAGQTSYYGIRWPILHLNTGLSSEVNLQYFQEHILLCTPSSSPPTDTTQGYAKNQQVRYLQSHRGCRAVKQSTTFLPNEKSNSQRHLKHRFWLINPNCFGFGVAHGDIFVSVCMYTCMYVEVRS